MYYFFDACVYTDHKIQKSILSIPNSLVSADTHYVKLNIQHLTWIHFGIIADLQLQEFGTTA